MFYLTDITIIYRPNDPDKMTDLESDNWQNLTQKLISDWHLTPNKIYHEKLIYMYIIS